MLINAITGFSASSRKSKETLDGFLDNVLADMADAPKNIAKNINYSSNRNCIGSCLRSMMTYHGCKHLVVGKSMGGVKVWWLLTRHWLQCLDILNPKINYQIPRIGVVLIDPHGWQTGDGRVGSYGVFLRKLGFTDGWIRDNFKIHVIYQRNKYPKGARLDIPSDAKNALNTKLGKYADHWKVTEIDTKAGREVADAIQGMIRWIMM